MRTLCIKLREYPKLPLEPTSFWKPLLRCDPAAAATRCWMFGRDYAVAREFRMRVNLYQQARVPCTPSVVRGKVFRDPFRDVRETPYASAKTCRVLNWCVTVTG